MITVTWDEVRAMNKAQVHNLDEILEFHKKYLCEENEDEEHDEIRKEESE